MALVLCHAANTAVPACYPQKQPGWRTAPPPTFSDPRPQKSEKYCEEVLSAPNEREVTMPELLLEMRAAAMEGDVVSRDTQALGLHYVTVLV